MVLTTPNSSLTPRKLDGAFAARGQELASPGKNRSVESGLMPRRSRSTVPSKAQLSWLRKGISAPGYKLPLFDRNGQGFPQRMIKACLEQGWVEPWFSNPLKPDWLVCRLTEQGLFVAKCGQRVTGASLLAHHEGLLSAFPALRSRASEQDCT